MNFLRNLGALQSRDGRYVCIYFIFKFYYAFKCCWANKVYIVFFLNFRTCNIIVVKNLFFICINSVQNIILVNFQHFRYLLDLDIYFVYIFSLHIYVHYYTWRPLFLNSNCFSVSRVITKYVRIRRIFCLTKKRI